MGWRKVFKAADLAEGEKTIVDFGDRDVALFHVNGRVYARHNTCPHAGGPLGEGRLLDDGKAVECPWHQWVFSLETGACETVPDEGVRCFQTKVEEGFIWIQEAGNE